MDVQRREQEVDERDERGRVFKSFHGPNIVQRFTRSGPYETKGGSFDPPFRIP